jgi:hypothetical protein
MKTGSSGTFVVSWVQTEIDGIAAPPRAALVVGASWRWTGDAVRMDGVQGLLQLNAFEGQDEMRCRAARAVRRLIGVPLDTAPVTEPAEDPGSDRSFVLTDGLHSYQAELVDVDGALDGLLVFVGAVPPQDQELWVVRRSQPTRPLRDPRQEGGVICFTPGTYLSTPDGPRRIEDLRAGDLVCTRDNGPQPVVWRGHRRMSGARLYAMPHLRPIRIRSDAFGIGQPDRELIVSPQHRMLIRGRAAEALFHTDEVLVAAEDLLNDLSITVDHQLREVTYVHVLLERHQIVWANGLLTESFHPAHAAPEAIDPAQRQALAEALPALAVDPLAYGDVVRRYLTGAEAAILRHQLAA